MIKIVKYEDLVSNTKDEMNKICKFLNLKYQKNLIIPTENSELGIANSMYSESRVLGTVINQSRNLRWKKELTEKEKKYIISILYNDAIRMGYIEWYMDYINKYKNNYFDFICNKFYKRVLNLLDKNLIIHLFYEKIEVFIKKFLN